MENFLDLYFNRYPLEWAKTVEDYMYGLKAYVTGYQPCYNVLIDPADIFLFAYFMLVKILILTIGIVHVLPQEVSITLFPTSLLYYHMYLSTTKAVPCEFNLWYCMAFWTLLWQFPPIHFTRSILMWYAVATVFFSCLELVYIGCTFAIDVFILVTTLWFLVESFWRARFNVTFVIAACGVLYFQQGRGPHVPEIFYIFMFFLAMGVYAIYTLERGTNNEMLFFISTVIGITLLLIYNVLTYGFSEMESSKGGLEFPFNRLPVFYNLRLVDGEVLENEGDSEVLKALELNTKVTSFEDDPRHAKKLGYQPEMKKITTPRPIYIDIFPISTPEPELSVPDVVELEIESINFTINDDGSTTFSAMKLAKHRNEPVPPTDGEPVPPTDSEPVPPTDSEPVPPTDDEQ